MTDVNDRGQIVGSGFSGTNPATAVSHGFVLRGGVKGAFTPIDVPGALGTGASGINDRGQVTGGYTPPAAGSTRQPTGTQPSMGLGL